ncbi:MAG: hypothetical protein J0L99_18160 [Chitinophagales bacterium]|nr:hypothetical protein [Chitinophagales bacterium]
MRYLLLLCLICSASLLCAQEFQTQSNGLIYDAATIQRLHEIADSLDIKYKVCDPNPQYNSYLQGLAVTVSYDSTYETLFAAMNSGLTPQALKAQFPKLEVSATRLYVLFPTKTDVGEKVWEVRVFPDDVSVEYEMATLPKAATWEIDTYPKNHYRESAYLSATYFISDPRRTPTPLRYARMVQYADCMIDTTTTIYLSDYEDLQEAKDAKNLTHPALDAFENYINPYPRPAIDSTLNPDKRYEAVGIWREKRKQRVAELSETPAFKKLLRAAVAEAAVKKLPNYWLEQIVSEHLGPRETLTMKRLRRVYGQCSMDSSPRDHALEIAQLSARAAQWEVFLRAHLDILNDNFSRMTDGSYAWGRRQTYLKELEALSINVPYLMLGIALRVDNVSENHYFGAVGRVGRALAESKDLPQVESILRQGIADPALDDLNRKLFYYLYAQIQYWKAEPAEDEEAQALQEARIKAMLRVVEHDLPQYLREPIADEDD